MTDAQTEARAIETVRDWLNGGCSSWGLPSQQIETLLTALAAKDAELEKVKAECDKWREAFGEMHRQTMRAEAQLAEARKALEPFARHIDEMKFDLDNNGNLLPDDQAVGWVYVTNGDFRAARRALTGGKDDG